MTRTRAKGKAGGTGDGVPATAQPAAGSELEGTVVEYLIATPDLFVRRPDVLTQLRVPHGTGGAVSLIEHQVKVLRSQLDTERARLAQLIARARDYESFSTRLHSLVLQLITAPDLEQVQAVLHEALRREFSAEAVTLRLFPPEATAGAAEPAPLAAALADLLALDHTLCGPLDESRGLVLFGAAAGELRCAALVPIRAEGRSGVLAIGASDPERFRPDMGTDLLDRLGEIVSHKLRVLSLDAPGHSADPEPRPAAAAPKAKSPRRKRAKTNDPADPATEQA